MSATDLQAAMPIVLLAAGAAFVLVFERAFPADERVPGWLAAAFALAASAALLVAGTGDDAFGGVIRRDGAAVFFGALVTLGAAVALSLDAGQGRRRDVPTRGRYAYTLLATGAGLLLVGAADLLILFLSVELLFMSLFALVAGTRAPSTRAASRSVFVLTGTASALLAAGVGLVWSETGSFGMGSLTAASTPLGQAGVALVLIGLACFAGLAPFHWWVAPALEALPAPTAAAVTIVPRIAALVALVRCGAAITATGSGVVDWRAFMAILAATSLLLGVIPALTDRSLTRCLGHLSVGYSGLLAIAAASGVGASTAVAIGSASYALLFIGAFAMISLLPTDAPAIGDLRGLARRRPIHTVALGIALVGLAGSPPTIGFFARLAVLEAAVGAQLAWLAFAAAFATVVALAACVRVLFACVERGPGDTSVSPIASAVLFAAAIVSLVLGLAPGPLLDLAQSVRF